MVGPKHVDFNVYTHITNFNILSAFVGNIIVFIPEPRQYVG
jgi:hypothetical protein